MGDFICDVEDWAHVPDHEYEAICIKCETGYGWGRKKMYLHFKIIDLGPHNDKMVFMPINYPDGVKVKGFRSKYYQVWCQFHGKRPSKNATMSPRIFKNKICTIRTRTVKPKSKNNSPGDFPYSVVDEIVEVIDNDRMNLEGDDYEVPF